MDSQKKRLQKKANCLPIKTILYGPIYNHYNSLIQ